MESAFVNKSTHPTSKGPVVFGNTMVKKKNVIYLKSLNLFLFIYLKTGTQLTFTFSKSTIEALEKRCEICLKSTIKTSERRQTSWRRLDVVLVFLLLTWKIFHISFRCFYCWLWTRRKDKLTRFKPVYIASINIRQPEVFRFRIAERKQWSETVTYSEPCHTSKMECFVNG